MKRGPLQLDVEALNACVACGLCLPHCPTYRVTGREIASPRGRIAAMRAVEWHDAPIDAEFRSAMDECVECRGCEAACPSGVQFGALMEHTRAAIAPSAPRWRRTAETIVLRLVLPVHWVLLALTRLLALAQRTHLVPQRLGLPRISLRPLDVPIGGNPDAWLFTGCVMDAWFRDTHRAAARVMSATGASIARPGGGGDCCGALHAHAGRLDQARRLARRVIQSMPGAAPIVVDSAGCGAMLKEYGELLGSHDAHAFSARVRDFSEWLAQQPPLPLRRQDREVVVQDACHLRHVQRAHGSVRTVLAPAYRLRELDDAGLCCGAGGGYRLAQPALSHAIGERKVAAIKRAAADAAPIVASPNPGCVLQLRSLGVDARHPAELLAVALERA
ncbi:MAG TPA: (Fe-S)-binding protein [Acidimicrobiia bacterium]|nr:(Fe-S)-binding protein [Acidimicrobiia bacterium]